MTRRSLTILLHWSAVFMLLAMIKGGASAPALRWAFATVTLGWVALALSRGLMARPGPKLQGPLRHSFRALHWGMYGLTGLAGLLNVTALLGLTPTLWAWNSLLLLLIAGTFHGLFHVCEHVHQLHLRI